MSIATDLSLMFDTVYSADAFGVAARLRTAYGKDIDLTVIDDTAGAVVNENSHGIGIQTIKPAVSVRGAELVSNSIDPNDLDGSTITLRPDTAPAAWRVEAHHIKPSPSGELAGEVQLVLIKVAA